MTQIYIFPFRRGLSSVQEMYTESHWVMMSFVKVRLCTSHTLIKGAG